MAMPLFSCLNLSIKNYLCEYFDEDKKMDLCRSLTIQPEHTLVESSIRGWGFVRSMLLNSLYVPAGKDDQETWSPGGI